jgi:hypothetical protein
MLEASVEQAYDEGWQRAERYVILFRVIIVTEEKKILLRFKLHLRPTVDGPEIPPLPHRETATSVLADFLRYLFECAKTFIEETHANGRALWLSLQHNVQFVMAHPNGWEGKPQSQMCDAAVIAGLIPNSNAGRERLRFVTEGEANLHFCIQNGLATQAIDVGDSFARCLCFAYRA